MSEFVRMIDLRGIGAGPVRLSANPEECAALARRFGLVSIARFAAEIELVADKTTVDATGRLSASVVQSCAVSGEDLPVEIEEPLQLRFVPEGTAAADEIELEAGELDEIPYAGTAFDLGEALAQSLALAIDPFAAGPGAEEARHAAGLIGEGQGGAFAALAALKGKPE